VALVSLQISHVQMSAVSLYSDMEMANPQENV
jgi:hypothetical protein